MAGLAPFCSTVWTGMPLLDGLGEVADCHRDAAVAAIDAYHASHPLVAIAVCCRSHEYAALFAPPQLYGTLTIQPLAREQVTRFLNTAGDRLAGVRAALAADPNLWELTTSPLLLSIMLLA